MVCTEYMMIKVYPVQSQYNQIDGVWAWGRKRQTMRNEIYNSITCPMFISNTTVRRGGFSGTGIRTNAIIKNTTNVKGNGNYLEKEFF